MQARDLGRFQGGTGFPLRFQGAKWGEYPFYKVSDMNRAGNERFMTTANNYISEAQRSALSAPVVPRGAVVFAKVGAAVFLERKRILAQDACIDNNMAAFIPDPSVLTSRFAHYAFERVRLGALVASTALPSLNNGQLGSVLIWLPRDMGEQQEIVDALSDADALIAGLERMIAKKEAVKQGMMQQLLTGRTRLPSFTDPWQTRRLGDIGSFLKGRGIRRGDVRQFGVPCVRYGELYTGFRNYTRVARSYVRREVADAATPLEHGDLLFAGSGETRVEIGNCAAYLGPLPAVAGGDVIVLRGTECNPVFLGSLLNAPDAVRQKSNAGQGDAVVHISAGALAGVQVALPSRPEQDAIGSVIEAVDLDLRAAEGRLGKAQLVKEGMMQQLLTGRVRF